LLVRIGSYGGFRFDLLHHGQRVGLRRGRVFRHLFQLRIRLITAHVRRVIRQLLVGPLAARAVFIVASAGLAKLVGPADEPDLLLLSVRLPTARAEAVALGFAQTSSKYGAALLAGGGTPAPTRDMLRFDPMATSGGSWQVITSDDQSR